MFTTEQFQARDFHIVSDALTGFKPVDAICQFMYKGYKVSVSTAGLSQGACQTEVQVMDSNDNYVFPKGFHTVEEAIISINYKVDCPWLPAHKAGYSSWKVHTGKSCPLENSSLKVHVLNHMNLKLRLDEPTSGQAYIFDWSKENSNTDFHIAIYCHELIKSI